MPLKITDILPNSIVSLNDGSDGFIAVIIGNGDGTYTGLVYKVPGQLILDNMK